VAALLRGTATAWEKRCIVIVPGVGHHHASPSHSEGAGVFCDVPLAWLELRRTTGRTDIRALYIDTDVHHANGFARARMELEIHEHFFMLDFFNVDIWPHGEDGEPASTVQHVNIPMAYHCGVNNRDYLALIQAGLNRAASELLHIDIVFYMCCNDALKGDPLGKTNVTERAIYHRDRAVVSWARARDLPIVVMPSGGYGPSACRVARESMSRLNDEYGIF
jgi:acetoin utilization deacetylase AcuC-like enzyme